MSLEQATRTFVSSVVFVDLVGYSRQPVSEQIALKERFNAMLSDTLGHIPVEGRIILDTGDGAAISFLNDPEDALFAAMSMRRASEALCTQMGAGRLRVGVNLGPVRVGSDINGHPSIVGDGVRVAEQIMSFAPPGCVTASRSFYEMVSRLSGVYGNVFKYEGSHTDKHVRDHDVYMIDDSDSAFEAARKGVLIRAGLLKPDPIVVAATPATASQGPGPLVRFLSDWPKVGFAAFILAGIAATLAMLLYQKTLAPAAAPEPSVPAAGQSPLVATPEVASAPAPAPAALVPLSKPVTAPLAAPTAAAAKPVPVEPAPVQPAAAPVLPAKALPTEPPDRLKADKPKREPDAAKPTPRRTEPGKEAKPAMPVQEAVPAPVAAPPVAEPAPVPAPAPELPLAPIARAPVEFPREALRAGETRGTVRARAIINAAGNVTEVEIINARPLRLFDRAVQESLRQWRFPPGADGRRYEVSIDFAR